VQELIDVLGEELSWTWLSVLRGAAAAVLSEYRACKIFSLLPANMRCWVQIPRHRMIRVSKYQGQNVRRRCNTLKKEYLKEYLITPKLKFIK